MAKAPADIDAYILKCPAEVQDVLEQVRETIRNAAPDAKEVISYQMPAFKQHGILVYFAAWKNHIGLYPPIYGDKTLEKAVARYAGPKGNLQFPFNEPIPYDLIERIVKLRVKQDTIPGQVIPVWFEATQTGHFEMACAQLCGLGHYRMRADVLVDSPEDFAKWEAENAPPPQEAPAAAAPEEKK